MRVVIAFDADKHAPKHEGVLRGERTLIQALLPICDVATAEWNIASGKGIDDLLVNGGTFRRLSRHDRPAPQPRVPRPCSAPGAVDAGSTREEVEAMTSERVGRRFDPPYRDTRALIGPPPGLAKTGSVLHHQETATQDVIWAVSRHEQADELVGRAETGRCRCGVERAACADHAIVLHHDFGRNAENCVEYKVVEAAQEGGYGHAIGRAICGTIRAPICARRNDCEYQRQFERQGSHVAPVEKVINRPGGIASTRVAILDDLDSGRLVRRTRITVEMIERALNQPRSAAWAAFLAVLRSALSEATNAGAHHRDAYTLLDDAARGQGSTLERVVCDMPAATLLIPVATVEAYQAALPGQLLDLLAVLQNELPLYVRCEPFTSGLRVHAGGIDVATLNLPVVDENGTMAFTGKALAVLTATPDPIVHEWLDHLEGEVVGDFLPRVPLPAALRVVQDVGAFYGKGAVAGSDNDALWGRAAAYLAEFKPSWLAVITHKSLRDQASAALGVARERILHFGNQRGSNALRDADLFLIIGTPAMDPSDAYLLACAAFRGEGAPPSERMVMRATAYGGWADAQGRGREVDVLTFADNRVAEIYETARRDELLQAVHRIRPFDLARPGDSRRRATVVLMTEFPITGLRIDELRFSGNAGRSEEARDRLQDALDDSPEGTAVSTRSLAERAGTSKDRAAAFLSEVSAPCPPTPNSYLLQVGGQTAEIVRIGEDGALPACTCSGCPAHQRDACNCGLYWKDDAGRWHCGRHFPPRSAPPATARPPSPPARQTGLGE